MVLGVIVAGCDEPPPIATSAPTTQRAAAKPIVDNQEKGPLKVTVTADKDRILSGESIQLTIHVQAEQGVEVGVPQFEGIVGDFEVTQTEEIRPDCEPFLNCAEWRYTLACVVPGEAVIPSLPFNFSDPREKADGTTTLYRDELATEEMRIRVDENLADVKGPMSLPIPLEYRILWWTLGVLGAVTLVALFARWIARRRRAATGEIAAPVIPPDEWALRELDLLAAEKLIERGRIQEYFYRLNALLRRYVELRFGFMAGEQTSEEFIRSLQDAPYLMDRHKDTLRRFTAACDPVKYARHQPTADEIAWVGDSARALIIDTAGASMPDAAAMTSGDRTRSEPQGAAV